jgi:hypothetical protein
MIGIMRGRLFMRCRDEDGVGYEFPSVHIPWFATCHRISIRLFTCCDKSSMS